MCFFTLPAESLIGILEAIGSHSVTSSELKQMIGLFAPLENGAQVNDSANTSVNNHVDYRTVESGFQSSVEKKFVFALVLL